MSVKIIDPAYARAMAVGYKGSISDFVNLINTNDAAYAASLDAALSAGVIKNEKEYKDGIKKLNEGVGPIPKKKTVVPKKSESPSTSDAMDSSSESKLAIDEKTSIRPQKNIPASRQKTFLQQAQENEMFRNKVGAERKLISPAEVKVETIREKVEPKKDIFKSKENLKGLTNYSKPISQFERDSKVYKNLDYKFDNNIYEDIAQDELDKTKTVFEGIEMVGIDPTDFARFLKNETNFLEDENVNSEIPKKAEEAKNKYIEMYLNDRKNFLEKKSSVYLDDEKKMKEFQQKANDVYNENLDNYKEKFLPSVYEEEVEFKKNKKEEHDRIKKGSFSRYIYDGIRAVEDTVNSFGDVFDDILVAGLDLTGSDKLADQKRLERYIRDKYKIRHQMHAEGKTVKLGNDTYTVTDNGAIIDQDTGVDINSFESPEKLKQIYDLSKNVKTKETFYDPRGYITQGANLVGNLIGQVGLTYLTGGAGRAAGMTSKIPIAGIKATPAELASVFGMTSSSVYNQSLQELRDAGINDTDAKIAAMKIGTGQGIAATISSFFLPNVNANKITQGLNTKLVIKEATDILKNEGQKGLANYLKNKAVKVALSSPELIKEGVGEGAQELFESLSQYTINQQVNQDLGINTLQTDFEKGEMLDTFLLAASAGVLTGGFGKIKEGAYGLSLKQNFNFLSSIDPTKLDEVGFKMVQKGDITEDQFKSLKTKTTNYRRYSNVISEDVKNRVNDNDFVELTQLLAKVDNLELQKKNSHNVFAPEFDAKINEVKSQIQELIKPKQNAIQEQTTNESVLGTEQPKVELQGVGEGNAKPEQVTEQKETITPEGEKVTVNIAPFYDTQVASVQEAEELRKSEAYQQYKQQLSDIAKQLGIEGVSINENVGGYTLDDGTDIVEISNSVELDGVDMDQAQEYATLVAALSPEVQESSIVSRPTTEGADNHKANLYTFKVSDLDEAAKSAKEAGIANFTIDDKNGTIKFIDVFEFKDPDLIKKFNTFAESLDKKQINYEQEQFQPVESRYLGTEQRRETFRRIKKDGTKTRGSQQDINNLLEKAIQRDAEFQGEEIDAYIGERPTTERFRMSESQSEQPDTRNDEEAIIAKMNEASAEEKGLSRGEIPPSVETNPIKESSSLSKGLDKVLKFLGLKNENQLLKNIEDFNGIPMILGMSDMLAAGTVKDSMGNDMEVDGGLLYNTLGKNINLAWAGVSKESSDNQVKQARDLYEANKELFDRLWAEGKIPQGHVPMAIMRMGNTAVNSNEAVFRYILPYVKSLPLKNRTEALKTYIQSLNSKAEGNAASFWYTELQDQIESGNLNSKEEVISYLEDLASKELKAHEKSGKEGESAKVKKIESFLNSIKKKKDGADRTFDDIKEDLDNKIEKIVPFMLMDYIKSNKIKTLDGFIEAVVDGSKQRAQGESNMFSLPVRSFIFSSLISPESTKGANNLPVIKTLLNGVKKADPSLFTARNIYDSIGEKSMLKANQGDVVGIMGIKVADENGNPAGGTLKAEHNNYGYGPEGRVISLIKNPKQGIDVFPEFRAKLYRVFKPSKSGKYPTIESAIQQTGGAFFMDAAFRGTVPAVDEMTDLKILIGKLRFAFPEVSVATTQEEFENFLNKEGIRTREKEGNIIYGVTKDGRIFLNPSQQTLRTPIHEFGHIWIDFLRSPASGKKGDELIKKGLDLVDGTPEYERALKEYGDRDLALEEALVELMAVKGDTIVNAAKKSQFLEWMNAVFKYIKDNFTRFKDFNQSKIKDLTLDEFINIGLADLFSGQKISGKFDARTAGEASRARFSKEQMSEENLSEDERQRLQNRIDGIIETSKRRGLNPDQQMENVIKNIQTRSPEYIKANDIEKEQIIRDIRKMFGKREKSPKTFKNVFGLDEIIKVTMPEKKLRDKQIKDLDRGAKMAKAAWLKANAEVVKKLRELEKSKKITSNQAVAVLSKFSKVNMFNEDSIERFLNYTEKVFNNAMYAEKIAGVKSKLKNAKKNVNSKIGIAEGLQVLLENMFAINPTVIPDSVLDKYVGLVNMLGERSTVLNLKENEEVLSDTMDVLKAVEAELSLVDQLKEVFDNSKNIVVDEDGKLNYSDTIKEMLDADEINEYEASVMKKYKSSIVETEAKPKMTEEEKAVEKNELINSIRTADLFVNDMPSREERDLIKELSEYFNTDALESFDNATLKNIAKLTENISNGFLPHYANEILNTMKADNRSKTLFGATLKAKPLKLSKLYNDIKSKFTSRIDRSRTGVSELIRSAPLYYIDEQFGNFKSKEIFDSLFKDPAKGHDAFNTEYGRIQSRLDKIEYDVLKSRGFDHDEAVKSNYKMMAYLLQLEKNANPDSDKVNNAGDYIDATIDRINDGNTRYNENDVKALQEIKDEYGDPETGAIDIDKLYKSFNKTEIEALKAIQEINKSLESKALYIAAIIRGERIKPLNNYVHHNVLHESKAMDEQEGKSLIDNFNKNLQPSTKAKNLVERTKGVKPLNFDVFSSTNRGAKFTLIDYHLTNPIRVARKTLAKTKEELKNKKEWNGKNKEVFNAMESAYNEALDNILMDSFTKSTFWESVFNELDKQGYRVMLAGTGKFGAELLSNASYVSFTNPIAFAKGLENMNILLSEDAFNIMDNSNSLETSRFFSNDPLTGKFVDQNILNKSNKSLGSMHDSRATNIISKLYNKTGLKKYKNSVELTADTLVSTPDKVISLPLWMGVYINEFEKITGKKIDLKKIASNDEIYMTENKNAIEKATAKADAEAVQAAATRNPFMGVLKGKVKPDQSFLLNSFNRFNNFLNTYNMFEFFTARRAVMNAIGKGNMTKAEGAKLLAAVITRMTLYGILMQQFGSGLIGLFSSLMGFDDDDDEKKLKEEAKKKGVDLEDNNWQKYGKYFASTISSLLLGRNFGTGTKMLLNTVTEMANEKYGGFLRGGKEYDPYKDAIQYNTIESRDYKDSGNLAKDLILKASGAKAPMAKTIITAFDEIMADPKKKKEAIERAENRMTLQVPLEIAGNAGFIPVYKDVRKEVMKNIYKSLEEAEIQRKIDKKNDLDILKKVKSDVYEPEMIQAIKRKEMELKGTDSKELEKYNAEKEVVKEKLLVDKSNNVTYKNKSEMEKYNPSLYEERFGDFSEWGRTYGADDKVDNMIDSYKEMLRDEEFGYYNSQSKHNKHKKDTRSQRSNDRESERGSERSGGR